MKKGNLVVIYIASIIASILLILLDQWTKILAVSKLSAKEYVLIPGVFEFRYINNPGAAWGILSGQRLIFIVLTIIICSIIVFFYVKTPKEKKYLPLLVTMILLFSGAIGNFIDRVKLGEVRDFLYFSLIDFPIFNVADCYVVVAAILLCVLVLFVYKEEDLAVYSLKKKVSE